MYEAQKITSRSACTGTPSTTREAPYAQKPGALYHKHHSLGRHGLQITHSQELNFTTENLLFLTPHGQISIR